MLLSIGSDMEVGIIDKKGNPISICGIVGGTKENPIQIENLPLGFMMQEDNVNLEFNIPVCLSRSQFVSSFRVMREHCTKIMGQQGLEMSRHSSSVYPDTELVHPNALVFGCEPDYNAWTKKENNKPRAENKNLRTCGGHIHVGSNIDMVKGVQNMDLFLGIPSILLDDNPTSVARRELYGKAGAMRPKSYGWEYRVLSNFWMFKDELVSWVYNQTKLAVENKNINININTKLANKIISCINTGDKKEAENIVNMFNINVPTVN